MRARWLALSFVAMAAGCLVPRYGVDSSDKSGGVQPNMASGGSRAGSASDAGADMGTLSGGATSTAGAGATAAGGSAGTVECTVTQKRCGSECVDIADVTYGCTDSSCNQSACPATQNGTLGCEAGACVIASCGAGSKKCDGKCVAIDDPTYGCGETSCDASSCPPPNGGTLVCQGTTCAVGVCGAATKECDSKCVPPNSDHGCSATDSCEACGAFATCEGSPSKCACVPNDAAACNAIACGETTNNCQAKVTCANTCEDPTPACSGNTCVACNTASDCPGPDRNVCARAKCTNHVCSFTTAPSGTACPAGTCSSSLPGVCKRMPVDAGGVSIDATEVTKGDYLAFVTAVNNDTTHQASYCEYNDTFQPPEVFPPPIKDYDLPVVNVDWCDANAYCQWAGRRLCGKIGGGANPTTDASLPAASQWMHACVGSPARLFPYGNVFDGSKCNAPPNGTSSAPVASFPGCQGGYPGIYDLAGNVWEWEDSCETNTGKTDMCVLRGGSYYVQTPPDYFVRCARAGTRQRWFADQDAGFRCCGP